MKICKDFAQNFAAKELDIALRLMMMALPPLADPAGWLE
jgi:hypothetical protein